MRSTHLRLSAAAPNVGSMNEFSVDPESPPIPFGPPAPGDEEREVNIRLSYIQNLLDQAHEALAASSDVRWVSTAADAFAEQLNVLTGTADTIQTAVDDTRTKLAALQLSIADAAQMQINLSAQVGNQPVPQVWNG